MNKTPTCFAFDFDHTLAFYQGGYDGLYAIFMEQGITLPAIQTAYERIRNTTGFSINALINAIEEDQGISLLRENILQQFDAWVGQSLTLYMDVQKFLATLSQTGRHQVAIVTRGDPEYQRYKIMKTGIQPHQMHFVIGTESKTAPLRLLLKEFGSPLLYVDDRASELDQIRTEHKKAGDLHLFNIVRTHGAYEHESGKFPHVRIRSLDELVIRYGLGR